MSAVNDYPTRNFQSDGANQSISSVSVSHFCWKCLRQKRTSPDMPGWIIKQSVVERIGYEDRILALGACGEHRHRRTDQLFDMADIFDRLRGKIVP